MVYHEGERSVQARAGVCAIADHMGSQVQNRLPPVLQEFLRNQPMAIAGTTDAAGLVWASLLVGAPGFLTAAAEDALQVEARRREGDPLWKNLDQGLHMGLLIIDLATRRRARLNGVVFSIEQDKFLVRTNQVYSNCSKYIQARKWSLELQEEEAASVKHARALTGVQQDLIRKADTFFIATAHVQYGADASHRGGEPGFVTVVDATHLQWPDYKGNSMFQTLGNISVNPVAGLLFLDWNRRVTLQLSGSAKIIWAAERTSRFPGAERIVEFEVVEAVEISGGLPLRWQFLDAYRFNPR